jgi:hypothetical protein
MGLNFAGSEKNEPDYSFLDLFRNTSEVIATVRDYVRTITPETPDAFSMLKNVLITRFSPTQIDNCFKLLDMPPMGDRHPLAYQSFQNYGSFACRRKNLLVNPFICAACTRR